MLTKLNVSRSYPFLTDQEGQLNTLGISGNLSLLTSRRNDPQTRSKRLYVNRVPY